MKKKRGKIKKPVKTVKEMTVLAGKAMKNGFYIETIWILSEIMEVRLKKIIIIAKGSSPASASGLEQYLKRIKLLLSRGQHTHLTTHFPSGLIASLRSWKNNRNTLMKDMIVMHVSWERKERLAKKGVGFLKKLNKVYKDYKLAVYVQPKHKDFIPEIPVSAEPVITGTGVPQAAPDPPSA